MTLRVTRQMAEALGSADGALRVTRQIVEVLSAQPGVNAAAANNLSLSGVATFTAVRERSTSNTLSLTQLVGQVFDESAQNSLALTGNATLGIEILKSASNALSLSGSTLFNRDLLQGASSLLSLDNTVVDLAIKESVTNALALAQSVVNNFKFVAASNTLALSDAVAKGSNILESVSNAITFAQTTSQSQQILSISNALPLAQVVSYKLGDDIFVEASNAFSFSNTTVIDNKIFKRSFPDTGGDLQPVIQFSQTLTYHGDFQPQVSNTLNLSDTVSLIREINLSPSSILSLTARMGQTFPRNASNVLTLLQDVFRIHCVASALGLTQTAVGAPFKFISQDLNLTDSVTKLQDFARSVTNTLSLLQSAAYQLGGPDICNYTPTVGTVSSGITPPALTAPVLSNATLQLRYPADAPTLTVVLLNPEFGNTDTLSFNRINRESRGGTLLIFADPTWPKHERMRIQIDNMKLATKNELRIFLESSIGREILLDDWENRTWRGIIVNPQADITQIDRSGFSITLEFEGALV